MEACGKWFSNVLTGAMATKVTKEKEKGEGGARTSFLHEMGKLHFLKKRGLVMYLGSCKRQ